MNISGRPNDTGYCLRGSGNVQEYINKITKHRFVYIED